MLDWYVPRPSTKARISLRSVSPKLRFSNAMDRASSTSLRFSSYPFTALMFSPGLPTSSLATRASMSARPARLRWALTMEGAASRPTVTSAERWLSTPIMVVANTASDASQIATRNACRRPGVVRTCGANTWTFGRCFRVVDLLLDGAPEFIPVDEQSDEQIMHLFRRRKADGAPHQPLDPGP